MVKQSLWVLAGLVAVPSAILVAVMRPDSRTPSSELYEDAAIPAHAPMCEGRDDVRFKEFVARFKADADFRERRTIYPVRYSVIADVPRYGLGREDMKRRNWSVIVGDAQAAKARGAERCEEYIDWSGPVTAYVEQRACGDDPLTYKFYFKANRKEALLGAWCMYLTNVFAHR